MADRIFFYAEYGVEDCKTVLELVSIWLRQLALEVPIVYTRDLLFQPDRSSCCVACEF